MCALREFRSRKKIIMIIGISLLVLGFVIWILIEKQGNIMNAYKLPDSTYQLTGFQTDAEGYDFGGNNFHSYQINEKLLTGNYTQNDPDKESISISIGKFIEDYPIQWVMGYGNHLPYQLVFVFPITFLNYGDQSFTIIDYRLAPYNCAFRHYTFRGKDGDMGLYVSPCSERPEYLPIVIRPGEGLTLFLKTAIAIDWNLKIPSKKFQKDIPTLFDLKIATTFANTTSDNHNYGLSSDYWGNETVYGVGARGITSIHLNSTDSINQPVYKIWFFSLQGNEFDLLFAPYEVRYTFPFEICRRVDYFDRDDEVFDLKFDELQNYLEWIK